MHQTIAFHISGPPLRYLKKCGRNMEKYKRDNFAVLVNRISILQFSSRLSILGGLASGVVGVSSSSLNGHNF